MQLNAYLNFNGECEAAFKFYEQVLGGEILMMSRFRGTPGENMVPEAMRDKIIHARMAVGDTLLMGSDAPHERASEPKGFALSLQFNTATEAEAKFKSLSDKGEISMPMGKTFFAERFGMLKDRFGIPWMVVCEKES